MTFANVTVEGDLTVKATAGEHPNIGSSTINGSKDVNVYWSFTNSGITCDSYSARLNFPNLADIDVGANPANFIVGKWDGSWAYPAVGERGADYIIAAGMTTFSSFAVGESGRVFDGPGDFSDVSKWDGGNTSACRRKSDH